MMVGTGFSERRKDVPGFVRAVLREQEEELDRLIHKLSKVTGQLSGAGEVADRLVRARENLETLRVEIRNVLKCRFDDV
jgi:hypothetical protein